jgi:hypothetical protein
MNEAEFKKIASLEEAYSKWQGGTLAPKYLERAARLQCECGNAQGLTCFTSAHHDMRIDMISAHRYLDERQREQDAAHF